MIKLEICTLAEYCKTEKKKKINIPVTQRKLHLVNERLREFLQGLWKLNGFSIKYKTRLSFSLSFTKANPNSSFLKFLIFSEKKKWARITFFIITFFFKITISLKSYLSWRSFTQTRWDARSQQGLLIGLLVNWFSHRPIPNTLPIWHSNFSSFFEDIFII